MEPSSSWVRHIVSGISSLLESAIKLNAFGREEFAQFLEEIYQCVSEYRKACQEKNFDLAVERFREFGIYRANFEKRLLSVIPKEDEAEFRYRMTVIREQDIYYFDRSFINMHKEKNDKYDSVLTKDMYNADKRRIISVYYDSMLSDCLGYIRGMAKTLKNISI